MVRSATARVIGIRAALCVIAVVGAANLLHRVVVPARRPDPATYPRAGDTFGSKTEGFTQHVVAVRDGWLILRSRIAPHAPGPPTHVHGSFAEHFSVESGTLSLELPTGVLRLGPGAEYTVAPGIPHRPFNPTDTEVVASGDALAMPQAFGGCLVQIYHFLDAAEGHMSPDLMLRIAAMDRVCDSQLAGTPALARVGVEWMVLPFARTLGYANYYPELSLHPPGRDEVAMRPQVIAHQ